MRSSRYPPQGGVIGTRPSPGRRIKRTSVPLAAHGFFPRRHSGVRQAAAKSVLGRRVAAAPRPLESRGFHGGALLPCPRPPRESASVGRRKEKPETGHFRRSGEKIMPYNRSCRVIWRQSLPWHVGKSGTNNQTFLTRKPST